MCMSQVLRSLTRAKVNRGLLERRKTAEALPISLIDGQLVSMDVAICCQMYAIQPPRPL